MFQKQLLWFNANNRPKQIRAGMIAYMCSILLFFLIFQTLLLNNLGFQLCQVYCVGTLVSLLATLACGFVMEHDDKLHGGSFSWSNVLATMVVPIGVTFFIFIVLLLSLF